MPFDCIFFDVATAVRGVLCSCEVCCAVLCCAVLCCAVLCMCCAVLCCAVRCCAVLCCAVLWSVCIFCEILENLVKIENVSVETQIIICQVTSGAS